MEIRCLKAEHGDAIIIAIQGRDRIHFIVIDGGPNSKFCTDRIVEEYNKLREIDLMVLTHYDDDHIGGLLQDFGFGGFVGYGKRVPGCLVEEELMRRMMYDG